MYLSEVMESLRQEKQLEPIQVFKDEDGKWLWPGYGDNSRVLEWVFHRVTGKADAQDTPIGFVPAPDAIDIEGLSVSKEDMHTHIRESLTGRKRANLFKLCLPCRPLAERMRLHYLPHGCWRS